MSGKKENFVVSPVIQPGSNAKITIKQNSQKKFEFGLFSRTDLGQDDNNVHVNLFDARQALNGKKIYIWRNGKEKDLFGKLSSTFSQSEPEKGKFEAYLVLTDEADPLPLRDTGTEHYRDAERISKKDWLGWIVPNAVTAISTVFTSILTAVKLSSVVKDYKQFLSETENTNLRTKLDQLQVGRNKYFLQRKLRKEGNASIASSDLLRNIPRSKTSLVSGPSGSGKSTLAANITVDWAESEDDENYDVVLYLSSLNTTKSLTLHKLVWGEFAGSIGDDSKEMYRELLEREEKILVIIDGLGNKE